jgi:hypothetical protein
MLMYRINILKAITLIHFKPLMPIYIKFLVLIPVPVLLPLYLYDTPKYRNSTVLVLVCEKKHTFLRI